MLRPSSMLRCWARISFASALRALTARSLRPAASLAPSPRSWSRSRRSLAWPCTAAKESRRRRKPTSLAICAALDLKMRLWPGKVSTRPTLASASFWTRVCTSSLVSPHAPNTQPFTLPKVLSLLSTGPIWRGGYQLTLRSFRGVPVRKLETFYLPKKTCDF